MSDIPMSAVEAVARYDYEIRSAQALRLTGRDLPAFDSLHDGDKAVALTHARALIEVALAALWQPIDALTTHEPVLLALRNGEVVIAPGATVAVSRDDMAKIYRRTGSWPNVEHNPVAWMPIPAPPEKGNEK